MENNIIEVENISKRYLLNHQNTGSYNSLRDVIADKAQSIFRPSKIFSKTNTEEFWALSNVSFQIKQGDRVGIIGRNGAGKSTLLKILSRIVTPTKGRITIDGRVASLLEVGTGFHPELTGRENIFLNGSILGMRKTEIKSKFDEIVEFSGVEQFLDTPVKRYSSGMYVRLAFAVAAHLEPEILIVDEVLAVGDAEFQKKCLGKMKDVSSSGRTVLFVSHNMAAIQSLCDKAIYLYKGEVLQTGEVEKVIAGYLKDAAKVQAINLVDRQDRKGNGAIRFEAVELKDTAGNNLQSFQCGKDAVLQIKFSRKNNQVVNNLHVAIGLDDDYGTRITQFSNEVTSQIFNNVNSNTIELKIEKLPLKQGSYPFVLFSTVNAEIADWIQQAGNIDVEAGDFYNTGKLPPDGQGTFYINHSFELK